MSKYIRFISVSLNRLFPEMLDHHDRGISLNTMYDAPPSVRGASISSSFSALSFITPTPSHFISLALAFSVIINTHSFHIFPPSTRFIRHKKQPTKKTTSLGGSEALRREESAADARAAVVGVASCSSDGNHLPDRQT